MNQRSSYLGHLTGLRSVPQKSILVQEVADAEFLKGVGWDIALAGKMDIAFMGPIARAAAKGDAVRHLTARSSMPPILAFRIIVYHAPGNAMLYICALSGACIHSLALDRARLHPTLCV